MQLHNVILIVLSSYMCCAAVYYAWGYGYRIWGNGYKPSEVGMGKTAYIFYVSKLYEFMDTVRRFGGTCPLPSCMRMAMTPCSHPCGSSVDHAKIEQ